LDGTGSERASDSGKGETFGAQELNVREGREGRVNRYNGDKSSGRVCH